MTDPKRVSLRDLVFVRDVLIPRAWVTGSEVDDLVQLRARIDAVFAALRPAQEAEGPPAQEETPC